jgi:hypothetical protein
MAGRRFLFGLGAVMVLLLPGTWARGEEPPTKGQEALHLMLRQKECLSLEPILVTLRLQSQRFTGIPAAPGAGKRGTLRFEIEPALKPRGGAKPLPLEGQGQANHARMRDYDLFEWFAFPETGTWSVKAVFEHKGTKLTSSPVTITLQRPAKEDPEYGPMTRIHHTPWSNYDTNAFCGDTFDVVKRWPKSRFAKYCHYWNGRFLQNKKEYEKAIASYRMAAGQGPDFAFAPAAEFGIVECLYAQKKFQEAKKANATLCKQLEKHAAKAGRKPGMGQTIVQRLADAMTERLNQALALAAKE